MTIYFFQDNYYTKVYFDEDVLPAFLIPAGKWKIVVELLIRGKIRLSLAMGFEIIEFISEKQKKYG